MLNFAACGVGGRCFTASGSHSRWTVALADFADDLGDVIRLHALFGQFDRTVHERLRHRPAGVGLERDVFHDPRAPQILTQRVEIRLHRRRKRAIETVRALEHGAWTVEAAAGHQRGADARLRGPSGVHPLRGRPLGEGSSMMPDAMLPAMPSAEAISGAAEPERGRHAAGGSQRAKHRGGVKAGRVRGFGSDEAQAAHQLRTCGHAEQQPIAAEPLALARRERRWNDHGPGVCTGPPSKVSSKSSPCAAVPLTSAAPNAPKPPS